MVCIRVNLVVRAQDSTPKWIKLKSQASQFAMGYDKTRLESYLLPPWVGVILTVGLHTKPKGILDEWKLVMFLV